MSKTTVFSILPSASRNLKKKKKNLKTQLWVKRKEREREDYSLPWTEILLLNKNPAVKIRLLLNWIVSFRSGNYKSMEQSFCYYGKPSVWAGSLINFMCWIKHMLTLWSQLTTRPPARDFPGTEGRAMDASNTWDWRGLGRCRQIHSKAKWQ